MTWDSFRYWLIILLIGALVSATVTSAMWITVWNDAAERVCIEHREATSSQDIEGKQLLTETKSINCE